MTAVEATSVTEEEQSKPLALRIGAELVGSFIICFAIYSICTLGSAIYGVNMAFIALLTGLVYAAATLIFGTISGAQFNPAVSVAAMLSGKTHVLDGVLYIIVQVLGGIGAGAAIRFLLPTSEQVTLKIWHEPDSEMRLLPDRRLRRRHRRRDPWRWHGWYWSFRIHWWC